MKAALPESLTAQRQTAWSKNHRLLYDISLTKACLDDLFLGSRQAQMCPVKALAFCGPAPHHKLLVGVFLLMPCNHAGPHKEDADISVCAGIDGVL